MSSRASLDSARDLPPSPRGPLTSRCPLGDPLHGTPSPETTIVDETNGGRVAFGKASAPRARRVERRMLKIDDSDDEPRRPPRPQATALSDLFDGPDR